MDMLTTLHTSAHQLGAIPDGTVQAVITSPPYYGLRSYAGEQDIEWPTVTYRLNEFTEPVTVEPMRCALGLEPSPVAFVGHLILCLREWRRVLRDDGCIFVNLGDSYVGNRGNTGEMRYSLCQDLTDEQIAYIMDELAKARRISSATQDGR